MRRSVEVSGKNLDEVLERASRYFDVEKNSLAYEIISENRGFLGILVPKTVRVRVWVGDDEEKQTPVPSLEEKPPEPKVPEPSVEEEGEGIVEKEESVSVQELVKAREEIREFFEQLISKMKIEIEYHVREDGKKVYLDIDGQDAGLLIGKHGETLEALESYLKIYLIKNGFARVGLELDISGYKKRREETLNKLAQKMAGKVLEDHRKFKFEPMNARERRIIHTTLKDHPNVITYSIGEEPDRRVVIDLKNGKKKESSHRRVRPPRKK
ncbi:MAG: RNA-binding cell elongation regulator Jag/EloR [Atribacterota bacterium]